MLDFLPVLVLTGAAVGFTAALLGVGGGFIMVPVMYWVMLGSGLPEDIALLTAFGTSLFVMIPTVVSSTLRHHRLGAVVWRVSVILGPAGFVGALAASSIASSLPVHALKIGFGVLVLLIALRMGIGLRGVSCEDESCPQPPRSKLIVLGLVMGVISGLTGLGGGALMVPALVLMFHFPMRRAIATSSAAIIFTSVGGIAGYIVSGIGVAGRLPYSMGYINLAVWLSLIVLSIPMAQVGARTAHVVDARRLRAIFAVLMLYVGLRMMGAFEGIGL